ncbi:3-keto-5-aminohexanoate cleavage protein [Cribrihabitans neustonicus]|uniref:3-keto-5-aminohexanoate cleavage protein n=1 Tax=Cribrihabitans neustonicus TaxID=1429085 RepID=UPI003B598B60
MSNPCIICVAITGSLPAKENNPAVPITVAEQIESTQEAFEAGLYVQFVMGVKNAMPADEPIFDFYIETLKRLAPDAQWCAAGIGAVQLTINEWSIAKGGHTRTGLEDNVRLDRHSLAPSKAALVRRAVELCGKYERPVATWRQAREILQLGEPAVQAEVQ